MKFAVIGCGGTGREHARRGQECGLELVACGDIIEAKARALAKQHGTEATTDCVGLVNRPDVDIVAVTTPTPEHTRYVVSAAQAGKHVFCEKPFGRTLEQCEEALEAVRKTGVKLFVGHVVRFFQEFEKIKTEIQAGKIGKPGFVKTFRGGICPIGEGGWFRDFEQSGGVTLDCIVHDFDWIRYVFGDPERVFCQEIREQGSINYSLVTFRMKTGLIAHVVGSWAHPAGFSVRVEVCGDKGMVAFDAEEAPVSRMMREGAHDRPGMIRPSSPVDVSPYALEWQDFLAWIQEDRPPRVTPDDAVWAVRMCLGALESAQTGQPVNF